MTNRKSSLGKGLGALIPQSMPKNMEEKVLFRDEIDEIVEEKAIDNKEGLLEVSIDLLETRSDQPRKNFNEDSLNELKESIEEYGIIQPIVVRKIDDRYQIIAGERRYRAAKKAGFFQVPVRVMEMDDKSIKEVSLIENIQREDLDPIEEALGYAELMEEYSYTQKELSERLGKSRSYIANSIRLLGLDEEIKDVLREGLITTSQGRTLLSVKDKDERMNYLNQFLSKTANIRDVEKAARDKDISSDKIKEKSKSSTVENVYKKDMENKLISHLGTKVNIVEGKKRSYLEIDFMSYDDLQRIIDIIER